MKQRVKKNAEGDKKEEKEESLSGRSSCPASLLSPSSLISQSISQHGALTFKGET